MTETAPTSTTGISRALVRISAGSDAGRSVVADAYGHYTIPDVETGSTINVSADGYVSTLRTLGSTDSVPDFQLTPLPRTDTHTMTGRLAGDVGTCSDGLSMKPCNIMTIAIHNPGDLDAALTWSPADAADVDLTLFRTGDSTVLARSRSESASERITATLPGGVCYELHVTYASGSQPVTFVLKAAHMN